MDSKKRDQYLYRKYGIRLKTYEAMLADQQGVCAICGKPPKSVSLHVDHDHKVEKLKINVHVFTLDGLKRQVVASVPSLGFGIYVTAEKKGLAAAKKKARSLVQTELKRRSVRGLLCWACNAGLQKWRDNPANLRRAAEYLDTYNQGTIGELLKNTRTADTDSL